MKRAPLSVGICVSSHPTDGSGGPMLSGCPSICACVSAYVHASLRAREEVLSDGLAVD